MSMALAITSFLITNGPALMQAGMDVATLWDEYANMGKKASAEGRDLTAEEFHGFMDKCLGSDDSLDAIIAKARADIAAGA